VLETTHHVHHKRNDPTGMAPPTMRVEYRVGFNAYYREWVCFEHTGYPRRKAEAWWRARAHGPAPQSVDEAVELAEMGALAPTLAITVESKAGEQYDRVVDHELGEKPPRFEPDGELAQVESQPCPEDWEVPF